MSLRSAALALLAALAVPAAAGAAEPDPVACSRELARNEAAMAPARHRACIVAVAGTYLAFWTHSIPESRFLVADDVWAHSDGGAPDHRPGNRARVIATDPHNIAAIKVLDWTVEGNTAWAFYAGYLTGQPDKPSFFYAERFTVEKGLVREVLAPAALNPDLVVGAKQ
jgi:hypothetical protein